jgi:hypothetical protein
MGQHIHIVGCSPRSGTTLMQEMMVSCFEIDEHCEHEQSIFKVPRNPRGVLCTKHPREVYYMPCVLRHNTQVTAIYVVRDPRDVVVSQHKKHPGRYYSNLRFWQQADRYARKLERHPRFLVVRYEDLVTEPDRVQSVLEKAMPFLKRRHAFSEFHLHAKISEQSAMALNGVRPVDTSSIGRWRNNLDRVASQLQLHGDVAARLIHYCYETDRQWLDQLPADPVRHDSVISDKQSLLEQLRFAWRVRRKCLNYLIASKVKQLPECEG